MTPVLAHRLRTDRSFERMYKRHVGDVYRYALAVLRQPADAEDVTQTTFLNAYRAFVEGDHLDSPRNRMIGIAHKLCDQRARQEAQDVRSAAGRYRACCTIQNLADVHQHIVSLTPRRSLYFDAR